ncbi:MAG: hypothetical protein IPJ11_03070 [Gemmatimonadetes bacterium]|nr:hypothetical protein [Gemmatimonadota bacterium]
MIDFEKARVVDKEFSRKSIDHRPSIIDHRLFSSLFHTRSAILPGYVR